MSIPVITAKTTSGTIYEPSGLTRLELARGLDSPAAAFAAQFAISKRPPELNSVTVTYEGGVLFEGKLDEQSFSLSQRGYVLSLEARDRGAGPLDNEAMPRTLWGANLTTMFTRLIAPYGFRLYNSYPSRTLPVYTVYKGTSEWDAFCGYVRRLHGTSPHAEGSTIVIGRPRPGRRLVFSNTKPAGVRFSSLEYRRSPYELISKIYLRDREGYYSSSVTNPAADVYGVSRTRYLIPATEYEDNPGLDANLRIRRAAYRSVAVEVCCPGIIMADPGDEAAVEDDVLSQQNLMIDELCHSVSENGPETRFTLRSWMYYG